MVTDESWYGERIRRDVGLIIVTCLACGHEAAIDGTRIVPSDGATLGRYYRAHNKKRARRDQDDE